MRMFKITAALYSGAAAGRLRQRKYSQYSCTRLHVYPRK